MRIFIGYIVGTTFYLQVLFEPHEDSHIKTFVDAFYFNVSLENGTVDSASFESDQDDLVRTSILSLPHKVLSFTFFPNKTFSKAFMEFCVIGYNLV